MRVGESGNVFFYIFIAVVLLAALSYAVAEGGRTSEKALTSDKLNMAASEIIDYGSVISKAVTQLRLRGITPEQISFAHPDHNAAYGVLGTNPDREIFNAEGGGIKFRSPPIEALAVAGNPFRFAGNNEIDQTGSTCGNAACSDLILFLEGVKPALCVRINELVGVVNPSGNPPVDAEIDKSHYFAGTYAYAKTVGDDGGAVNLASKTSGCFEDTASTHYVYFQVVLPR